MARDDPVVERVRSARRDIFARCNNDSHPLLLWAKRIEAGHLARVRGYTRDTARKP